MENKIIIGVVGPESTGKSELCHQLKKNISCDVVPEYAREYLEKNGLEYQYEDVLKIAQKQFENSKTCIENSRKNFVVLDTTLLVIKIWMQHVFQKVPQEIMVWEKELGINAYLLCNIDLAWQEDPMREHPYLRNYFFNWYNEELKKMNANYYIISGQNEMRIQEAKNFLDKLN